MYSLSALRCVVGRRTTLITNAWQFNDLTERLSVLRELDLELHDLVNRPLDAIAQVGLDAILDPRGYVHACGKG